MLGSKFYQAIVREDAEIAIKSLKLVLTVPPLYMGDLYWPHRVTELFKVNSYFSCAVNFPHLCPPPHIHTLTAKYFIYALSEDKIFQGPSAEALEKQDLKTDNEVTNLKQGDDFDFSLAISETGNNHPLLSPPR